ncbi:hypothetical protein WR25_10887 [Diploscapter pachys]|uniref:Uncharacterized protein n=1 Tax=Diploscapter pachys TaxID=2018661 RepID=A0A2A2LZA0_9BILA|nr:hypothetical protein WR25_10887 [Diploscapter pachys]
MRQEMDVEKKGGGAGWPEKDWRTGNDQGLLLPYFIGEERGDEAKPAANRCTGKYANRTEQLEEEEEKEEGEEDCADWEACGWTAGRRDNDEGKVVRRKACKRQATVVRRVRVLRRLRKHRESPNDVIAEDEKAAEEIFKDIQAQHGLQPPPSNDGFIEISKDGSSLPSGVHPPALPHFDDMAGKQHDSTQGPLPIEEPQTMVPPAAATDEISNSMSGDTMDQASSFSSNYGGEVVKEATAVQPYEPSTASYTPLTQTESHSEPVKSEYSHRIEGEMTTSQPYTEQLTSETLRGMGSREGLELVFYVALVFFQLHLLFDFVLRSWYEGLDDCANKDEDQTPFSLDSEFFKAVHDVVEDDRRDATVFLEGKDPDCKMGWFEFDGVDAVSRAGEKRIPGIVGPHVAAEGDGRSRVESRFHSLLHPFV